MQILNVEKGFFIGCVLRTSPIDAVEHSYLYRPAAVALAGTHQILSSAATADFNDNLNRPVLAQSFRPLGTEQHFTVAVGHLKSKGASCAAQGDPDAGDGQGNCNGARSAAAGALAKWLAGDPTGSGSDARLIIGDLNAYAREDPITLLKAAGYVDLIARSMGSSGYSFVFFGQAGYLDHALANAAMLGRVRRVQLWAINADEPRARDYNDARVDPGEDDGDTPLNPASLYRPDVYRSSDHDPVIITLGFTGPQFADGFEGLIR